MANNKFNEGKLPDKVHVYHRKHANLTKCGAGIHGSVIGNVMVALHPCMMCKKGSA